MRRTVSASIVLAVLSGFLVLASPAHAAAVGTVTVRYVPLTMSYTVTPATLTGAAGDTFTLADTMISGDGDPNVYVSLQDDSGSVSLGGASCAAATDCPVLDRFSGAATGVFTIEAPGTVKVLRANGAPPALIGTITISASGGGGSGGASTAATQTYTLRFTLPDGTECTNISPQTVTGGWVALPGRDAECTINGAPIVGWKAQGSQQILAAGMQVDVTGDQTFTAVLNDPNVWVELDANVGLNDPCLDARGSNLATSAERTEAFYRNKQRVILPAAAICTPPHARLVGWNTSGDGQGTTFGLRSVVPAADLIGMNVLQLHAMWQVAEGSPVTITWRPAGGRCTIETTRLAYGSAFAAPPEQVCTRAGYELGGWKKKADGSGPWLDGVTVTRNTVAYAQWLPIIAVPISWGIAGCADTFVSSTAIYDLPAASPCATTLALASFNSKADGSGGTYALGARTALPSAGRLYAQWSVPVTYDANGGACKVTAAKPPLGSEFDLPQETACTKAGYALAGWTVPGETSTSPAVIVPLTAVQIATKPTTYTAIWTVPITLGFDGNGGTCAVTQRTIGLYASYTLPGAESCTREGFALAAWTIKGTALTFSVPSDPYMVLMPAVFEAQWVQKVTVTFQSNGAACEIAPTQVGLGMDLVVPGAGRCQREGFTFKGWDVTSGAQAGQGTFYAPAAKYTVHAASVLRARWSGKPSCSTPAGPGVDWQGCDKRFVNLTDANLQGANLDGTNFSHAILDGANLTGSTTEGIDLSNASLLGTDLSGLDLDADSATLTSARFTYYELASCKPDCYPDRVVDELEELKAANFAGASLAGQNLTNAVLVGVALTSADLRGTNLSKSRLWFADLSRAKTKGLNLTGADMRLGHFDHLDLSAGKATLTDAVMSWHGGIVPWMPTSAASFVGSSLAGQDLRGRDLAKVDFSGSNLMGADLRDSYLMLVNLAGADLRMAQLSGRADIFTADRATLAAANLPSSIVASGVGADFTGAVLSSAALIGDFSGANFAKANLANATFKLANLTGARFAGATLTGATFELTNSRADTPALTGAASVTYVGG